MNTYLAWAKVLHMSLTFTYNCFIEAAFNNFKKLNFHKGDFKGYETEIETIDWDAELADLNLVASWNSFEEKISNY